MQAELIAIDTPTGQPLDGLLYAAADGPARGAVQLLHGNAMNFYVGAPRFLPPRLTASGLACLAYNRRGHGTLSTRNSRAPEGNALATVAQSVQDDVLAREFLLERGLPVPFLVGHSNGGMLAVRHAADHPDTPALVLLSAHRGGSSLMEVGCRAGLLAGDRLEEFTERARSLVAEGRGDELLLLPGWWHVMTAEVFCDQLDNVPDVLELAASIHCPVLYVRGELEPAALYPAEAFAERCGGAVDVEIVPGADHFYNGVEAAVASLVDDWLRDHL